MLCWMMGNAFHILSSIKSHFNLSRHDFSSLYMKYKFNYFDMNECSDFDPFWGALMVPDVACASWFLIPHEYTVFLLGMINIPAVALGMFSGGVVMKKYKLGIMGAAKFAFGTSLLGYFLSLFFFAMGCENSRVAGITVSYAG